MADPWRDPAQLESGVRWVDAIRPLSEKFTLPSKVGCAVRLDADAAGAVGQSIELLAQMLDVADDDRALRRQLVDAVMRERAGLYRLIGTVAALAVLLVALWAVA